MVYSGVFVNEEERDCEW